MERDRSFTTTWPLTGSCALRGDSHQFARTFRARALRCGGRVNGPHGRSRAADLRSAYSSCSCHAPRSAEVTLCSVCAWPT